MRFPRKFLGPRKKSASEREKHLEQWKPIESFPGYEVSDEGRIRSEHSNRCLGIYDNGHGVLQVVLRRDGSNHARAVHRLVAHAFLDPAPDETVVPIFLDRDRTNCRADNLEWRPRWFATKLTRQLKRTVPRDDRRILFVKTGVVYANALECANDLGGLEDLVLLTAQNRWGTTYKGSVIEFYYD